MKRRDFIKVASVGAVASSLLKPSEVKAKEDLVEVRKTEYVITYQYFLTRNFLFKFDDCVELNKFQDHWVVVGDFVINIEGQNRIVDKKRIRTESPPFLLRDMTDQMVNKWIESCRQYCIDNFNSAEIITRVPKCAVIPLP